MVNVFGGLSQVSQTMTPDTNLMTWAWLGRHYEGIHGVAITSFSMSLALISTLC